ncbi:MAG: hypothetical protein LBU43_11395 [Candidatus Accumulibacter sp.]|nr:hypothetical protein [Accumulibacter sp.]
MKLIFRVSCNHSSSHRHSRASGNPGFQRPVKLDKRCKFLTENTKKKQGNARKYHTARKFVVNFSARLFTCVKNDGKKSIPFNNQTALFQAMVEFF